MILSSITVWKSVPKYHEMEMLSTLLALCGRNPQVTQVDSPHKGPLMWNLDASVLLAKNVEQTDELPFASDTRQKLSK